MMVAGIRQAALLVIMAGLATACTGGDPEPGPAITTAPTGSTTSTATNSTTSTATNSTTSTATNSTTSTAKSTTTISTPEQLQPSRSATALGLPEFAGSDPAASSVARWRVEIVDRIAHDPAAFTQGLEVAGGVIYESTGLYGRSSLRSIDPLSGTVTDRLELDDQMFGEGLTVVADRVLQLTWKAGKVFVHDRRSLEPIETLSYDGEGWGLCLSNGGPSSGSLWMSDGSGRLTRRDPASFEPLDVIEVAYPDRDSEVELLNELECVGRYVIANVWLTTELLVIDPERALVVAGIDARPLLDDLAGFGAADDIDVLNGVAAIGDGTFWMTGKLWPIMYRVRLVPS